MLVLLNRKYNLWIFCANLKVIIFSKLNYIRALYAKKVASSVGDSLKFNEYLVLASKGYYHALPMCLCIPMTRQVKK